MNKIAILVVLLFLLGCVVPEDGILIEPNSSFVVLTNEEADYIINFLTDFLVFSREGKLDPEDKGFPKQFYLYDKDMVVSLGKMLFLFFQKQNYESVGVDGPYFIPKNQSFETVDMASGIKESYELALNGKIPKKVSGDGLQSFVYQALVGGDVDFDYNLGNLNIENRGVEIAFTFDIESGRYVSEKSEIVISPCESDNYSLGLGEDEIICDDPAYVAWMSPRDEKITYTKYPYPQVSGILGFKEILDYSERYGIPTTNFIVKKDIVAFNILDEDLVNRAKALVKKGLFEVGSHTRYHTNLYAVGEELAKKELKESKVFLEEFFNTSVFGFRAPYLVILKDEETYAKALEEVGYAYYSQEEGYPKKIHGYSIINKPWNSGKFLAYLAPKELKEMMKEKEYIITLDHPWNIVYQDGNILVEDPTVKDNLRAVILTAISNGGIPVMLKDLKLG